VSGLHICSTKPSNRGLAADTRIGCDPRGPYSPQIAVSRQHRGRADVECLERAEVAIDVLAPGVGRDPEFASQIGVIAVGSDRQGDGDVRRGFRFIRCG
jgi:hypothetical protein